MAIEHADFEGVEHLALVLGGEIVSTFNNPEKVKLGSCKLIEEIMIGEDKVCFCRLSSLLSSTSILVLLSLFLHHLFPPLLAVSLPHSFNALLPLTLRLSAVLHVFCSS